MAIENLPRPWLLAALTGIKLVDLLPPEEVRPSERHPDRALPQPERRRRGDALGGHRPEPIERLN